MPSTKPSHKLDNPEDGSEKCPSLGTPEYDVFVKKQSQNSLIDATNAHPILRVLSTIFIGFYGVSLLVMAQNFVVDGPLWPGLLSGIYFGVYGLFVLAYLRYSWGRRRRGSR